MFVHLSESQPTQLIEKLDVIALGRPSSQVSSTACMTKAGKWNSSMVEHRACNDENLGPNLGRRSCRFECELLTLFPAPTSPKASDLRVR